MKRIVLFACVIVAALAARLVFVAGLDGEVIFLPLAADIALAGLVYALSHFSGDTARSHALWISGLYLFSPSSVASSALLGRMDMAGVILLAALILLLLEYRDYKANKHAIFALYAALLGMWPQAIMALPVFAYFLAREYAQASPWYDEIKVLSYIAVAVLVFVITSTLGLSLPGHGATPILSVTSYGGMATLGVVGYLGIAAAVVAALVLLRRSLGPASAFYASAMVAVALYVFPNNLLGALAVLGPTNNPAEPSPLMVVPLLALSLAFRPDPKVTIIAIGFALISGAQLADSLLLQSTGIGIPLSWAWLPISTATLLIMMGYYAFHIYPQPLPDHNVQAPTPADPKGQLATRLDAWLTRNHKAAVVGLTLVYAVIAFARLGSLSAPQSFWDQRAYREELGITHAPEAAWLDMGEILHISEVMVYLGARWYQAFALFASPDDTDWHHVQNFEVSDVFAWHSLETNAEGRFFQIVPITDNLILGELEFRDADGQRLSPADHQNAAELLDEYYTVPIRPSFMNSTYFDEIYHPRTAFEFIHGMEVYEDTHPPLGKSIIAIGIRIFGMVPFGWRFMGTLFGVAMVPLMYILALNILGSRPAAFTVAALFSFDFMHFTQTRLATIDTYNTFFVILMYLFMYKFYKSSFTRTSFAQDCTWLGLCGLFMGLGIASKWQGVYAAAGLALLWLLAMLARHREYSALGKQTPPPDPSQHPPNTSRMASYPSDTGNLVCMCILFFVIVPVLIYIASYADYLSTPGKDGFQSILANQVWMFTYHSTLEATHPFSSPWWEWPLNIRPLFAYTYWPGDGTAAGISSFGNPIVWWGGLVGIIYCFGRLFDKSRPKTVPAFIFIGFAANYFPWVLVGRTTFIYHYFPSTPFITLALVYLLTQALDEKAPHAKYAILGTAIALFVAFYPVLAALPVPIGYIETFLRWFNTWQLI